MSLSKQGCYFFLSFFSVLHRQTQQQQVKKTAGEYDALQAMIIKNESQLLPIRFDVYTLLTEVTRENNVIILNYQVTGLPPELFREEQAINKMQGILTGKYCQDSAIMRLWQLAFPAGLQHNYFSDGTQVMQINIKPSDCRA
ncbi:hypothetical protein [Morganella morganii]|uniref:hypothetical protein n=1 Tax=Morganella morganii TaxID=582 RepID=UPI001C4611D2|nr:hypothetical protein [Morganella morganii]QXO64305.1 hypothetical protein JC825_12905 [Morganella morganii]